MYFFENKKNFGIWHIKCIFIALHQAFCKQEKKNFRYSHIPVTGVCVCVCIYIYIYTRIYQLQILAMSQERCTCTFSEHHSLSPCWQMWYKSSRSSMYFTYRIKNCC